MSKRKWREGSSTHILIGNIPVKTVELKNTGLGYFINPKPKPEDESIPVDDERDWYIPIHLVSMAGIGAITFFSEVYVRRFVRELSSHFNWSANEEALQKQDNWQNMGKIAYEICDRMYRERQCKLPAKRRKIDR